MGVLQALPRHLYWGDQSEINAILILALGCDGFNNRRFPWPTTKFI